MPGTINADELSPELRKKLKLDTKHVPDKVIALGKVFTAFQGLTTRDAYWVLKTATTYVPGFKRTITRSRQTLKPRKKEVSQ